MSYLDSLNRFAQSPVGLDIGRSKFNMPAKTKTTFTSGKLIPLMWKEVLPGDTFKCDVSAVVRSITPVAPVMDDSFFDLYYFFVPNRLCCRHSNDWAAVCGENFSGPWAQSTEATLENTGNFVAYNVLSDTTLSPDELPAYLGLPIDMLDASFTTKINILPFMAYQKIWNEWFRDQNVMNPLDFDSNNFYQVQSGDDYAGVCQLRDVSKLHDYFTSCLPAPQKAASVALPLGTFAPVVTGASEHLTSASGYPSLRFRNGAGILPSGELALNTGLLGSFSGSVPSDTSLVPSNLYADLQNATAASINAIRLAFALQRFAEKEGLSVAQGIERY